MVKYGNYLQNCFDTFGSSESFGMQRLQVQWNIRWLQTNELQTTQAQAVTKTATIIHSLKSLMQIALKTYSNP